MRESELSFHSLGSPRRLADSEPIEIDWFQFSTGPLPRTYNGLSAESCRSLGKIEIKRHQDPTDAFLLQFVVIRASGASREM